jgi:hypothetical protein
MAKLPDLGKIINFRFEYLKEDERKYLIKVVLWI